MAYQAVESATTLSIEEIVEQAPVMHASDLTVSAGPEALAPPSELSELLSAGLPPGAIVSVSGQAGSGAATLCYRMLAAGTDAGGYVALLDLAGRATPLAVLEAGVDPARFVLVRTRASGGREAGPSRRSRLASALGALLDGFAVVGILDPHLIGAGLWGRVATRARERRVLVIAAGEETPRDVATLHLLLDAPRWQLDAGGLLAARTAMVKVEGVGGERSGRVSLSPGAAFDGAGRDASKTSMGPA